MSAVQSLPRESETDYTVKDRSRFLNILQIAAVIGVLAGLYMALVYAETDAVQGLVQRIFYLHVASYAAAATAFTTAAVGGAMYLRSRENRWDTLALAGIEVGFTLSIITLITGMIWARPIWNTWWTWDPRLTSAAIMTLTYAAYLMLRNGVENPDQRRRFASIYGILALTTVIFTFAITRIRPDTIHPTVIGPSAQNAQGTFSMTAGMGAALGVNAMVWSLLVTPVLMWWRIRLENLKERALELRMNL